jgi:glycosyltransferase involved in cell wall biosynthesis
MTKISVIIPNYNQSVFVKDAIHSVLNQHCKADEIIIVDDGSTDDSREVVGQFGDRVHYIRQENQGLAGARNTGLQAAAGELIGLLDADDVWMPDYLETMVRLAEANPDASVYYCMAQCMDVQGNDLPQIVGGPPVAPHELYHWLLRQNFIIPSTVLFRKKPIVEAGAFDAKLRSCEDWDLWLRLLPGRKLIGTPQRLVRYRVHGSSLSTNVQGMHDATKRVIEKHFGREQGEIASWSPEKRRAYGGMYRYQVITYIQRQNNCRAAEAPFYKALLVDPSLAEDVSFFYELALGVQPVGYRGWGELPGFEQHAENLERLVHIVCARAELKPLQKRILGTGYFALGLASYNLGERPRSRGYFARALANRPELIRDGRLSGNFLKSFFGRDALKTIARLWRSAQ